MLFDVDGTLVDTNYLHPVAWSRALSDAGEWAPMNAIHRLVGMGGDQLVPEVLGHPCEAARRRRGERYREIMGEARVFPGAGALLQKCSAAGLRVVLASSAPLGELEVMRQLIDADPAIDAQTTGDEVGSSKPAPDVFVEAMRAGGIDPARALAVGDSVWDIRAARAAGIGCIAVETGGFSQHELGEAGARHVYRDVQELLEQFSTSPLHALL